MPTEPDDFCTLTRDPPKFSVQLRVNGNAIPGATLVRKHTRGVGEQFVLTCTKKHVFAQGDVIEVFVRSHDPEDRYTVLAAGTGFTIEKLRVHS